MGALAARVVDDRPFLGRCRGAHLATLAWAFARLRLPNPRLFAAIAGRPSLV